MCEKLGIVAFIYVILGFGWLRKISHLILNSAAIICSPNDALENILACIAIGYFSLFSRLLRP